MSKRKKAKTPRKARKSTRPKPRDARKDAKGVPLTSDRYDFAILPSDLSAAWRPPAGAPTKATVKMMPGMPTTVIPELNAIEITPFAYQTVLEAINAADKVQIKKLNPTGGANLRYRIELAAAFLAHVMDHAYDAAAATGSEIAPEDFLATNITIRRAEEIYGSGGA